MTDEQRCFGAGIKKSGEDNMAYCAECGKDTPHKVIRGLYAASADYVECNVCGRKDQIPKGSKPFEKSDDIVKAKVYVKGPGDVPKGVQVKRGAKGGLYYETTSAPGGSTPVNSPTTVREATHIKEKYPTKPRKTEEQRFQEDMDEARTGRTITSRLDEMRREREGKPTIRPPKDEEFDLKYEAANNVSKQPGVGKAISVQIVEGGTPEEFIKTKEAEKEAIHIGEYLTRDEINEGYGISMHPYKNTVVFVKTKSTGEGKVYMPEPPKESSKPKGSQKVDKAFEDIRTDIEDFIDSLKNESMTEDEWDYVTMDYANRGIDRERVDSKLDERSAEILHDRLRDYVRRRASELGGKKKADKLSPEDRATATRDRNLYGIPGVETQAEANKRKKAEKEQK